MTRLDIDSPFSPAHISFAYFQLAMRFSDVNADAYRAYKCSNPRSAYLGIRTTAHQQFYEQGSLRALVEEVKFGNVCRR